MDDITPGEVVIAFWRWFWVAVIGCALLAGLTLGCWQAGWWFQSHDATRQTQITQDGIGYQTGQQDQLGQQIANVLTVTSEMSGTSGSQLSDLAAQRLGDARLACAAAAALTAIPADEQNWVSQNCDAGTLSPASPLFSH
jgi:hypothetical protein